MLDLSSFTPEQLEQLKRFFNYGRFTEDARAVFQAYYNETKEELIKRETQEEDKYAEYDLT